MVRLRLAKAIGILCGEVERCREGDGGEATMLKNEVKPTSAHGPLWSTSRGLVGPRTLCRHICIHRIQH